MNLIETYLQKIKGLLGTLREGRDELNIHGEYWITDEGEVINASPGRHAEIATEEMFSKRLGGDRVLRWLETIPDSYYYNAYAKKHQEVPRPPKELMKAFEREIAEVRDGNPVFFMIGEKGWIRNIDYIFNVDSLSEKNVKRIADLLWKEYHIDPDVSDAGEKIVEISEVYGSKKHTVRVSDLMTDPESVLRRGAFAEERLSERLQGEFWLDDYGQETFADGDIGDVNHEGYAFWSALGIDPEAPKVRELDIYPGGGFSNKALRWLRAEGADEKAIKFFQKGGDARDWAMQEMGWIRVDDDLFQVYGLDDSKLKHIFDFVWEDREENPDGAIVIEDLKTRKTYEVSYADMESIQTVGDLYRKQDKDIRAPGQEVGKGVLPAGATDEPHFSIEARLTELRRLLQV